MSNPAPSVDPYDPGGVMKAFKRALGYDKKTFPRVDSSRTKERRRPKTVQSLSGGYPR
jgi:hypothetical protein